MNVTEHRLRATASELRDRHPDQARAVVHDLLAHYRRSFAGVEECRHVACDAAAAEARGQPCAAHYALLVGDVAEVAA